MRIDYKTYALPSVHHINSIVNRRASDMAIQHRLGILSQRRFGFNFLNRVACCLTSLGPAKRAPHATTDIGSSNSGTVAAATPQRVGNANRNVARQ
jgi:hypothetical protein